jgi:hypothetical protein
MLHLIESDIVFEFTQKVVQILPMKYKAPADVLKIMAHNRL